MILSLTVQRSKEDLLGILSHALAGIDQYFGERMAGSRPAKYMQHLLCGRTTRACKSMIIFAGALQDMTGCQQGQRAVKKATALQTTTHVSNTNASTDTAQHIIHHCAGQQHRGLPEGIQWLAVLLSDHCSFDMVPPELGQHQPALPPVPLVAHDVVDRRTIAGPTVQVAPLPLENFHEALHLPAHGQGVTKGSISLEPVAQQRDP